MKQKYEIAWDFVVDYTGNEKQFYKTKLRQEDIRKMTNLIKFNGTKANTKQEAQQIIDRIVNEYGLDSLPLIVYKKLINYVNADSYKSKVEYYRNMNPLNFSNVTTREDRAASRYYTTPPHLRIL